jgi:hypothetical protein
MMSLNICNIKRGNTLVYTLLFLLVTLAFIELSNIDNSIATAQQQIILSPSEVIIQILIPDHLK